MKRKRFSVEQIVAILKQAEMGMPVAELIRRVGISEQTFYRWKKQFTGLEIDQVRQLKQLQDEKRPAEKAGCGVDPGSRHVAGRAAKKLVKPSRRRAVVGYLCGAYRVSERHACEVVVLPRATHRYQSIRDPRTELRLRMRELAQARIRYGYRKIRVLLIREGWQVGKKLVYRLYREEGLGLRARPKARRTVSEHSRQKAEGGKGRTRCGVWIVADQLSDGRRFRALTVMDVYTRECLAIEVGQSLKGHDVVRVLQQISQQRGVPRMLFCDNGSEFTSQVMDLWAYHNGVKIDFSRPGKPTDNAYVESFNGTLRAECLDAHWFGNLDEACQRIEAWRTEYNASRPHRALGEQTPNEFARQIAASRDLSCLAIAGD